MPGAAGADFMADDDSGDEVKEHESELSATSDIEMMDIDDDDEKDFNEVVADVAELAAAR